MANKKISELPNATLPVTTGTKFEAVQAGINVQVDADDMPGGAVESVTGENNAVDNTDTANPIVRNGSRTITGASATVIGDNNGKVLFNSATPFNFTLDQLAANTTITLININAGDVTLVAGSGMTIIGTTTLPGASDPIFPSCVIIYDSLTVARVIVGGDAVSILARDEISIVTGTLTMDFIDRELRNFILDTATSSAFTLALTNSTNAVAFDLVVLITGAVAITCPSTFRMMEVEEDAGRWNTSTRVLTLTGTTGSIFRITGTLSDTVWLVDASVPYV